MNAILKGNNIYLRLLSPADFDKVLAWENDPENWRVSDTTEPYSAEAIQQFVSTPQDIFINGQLRLIICTIENDEAAGAIDLFEFDGLTQQAGVGILIDKNQRKRGFALEALDLLSTYALSEIGIRTLCATIHEDNIGSFKLFEKSGFKQRKKKESTGKSQNERYYQKALTK